MNVSEGYVEKEMFFFFQFRMSHVLRSISIPDLSTDSPSHIRCDTDSVVKYGKVKLSL
jgi:hypothetical protein